MYKTYLVCDCCDTKLMNYEELLELLCDELNRDTLDCYDTENRDAVEYNLKLLKSLVQRHYQPDEVIKQLDNFGWYVMDLTRLQRDLINYQAYKHGVGAPIYPNDCINQTLTMIDKDIHK